MDGLNRLRRPRHREVREVAENKWSRRYLLTVGCLATAAILAPRPALAHQHRSATAERSVALYNPHTGERLQTVYYFQGRYLPEALADINRLLRDYHTDEIRDIDPRLLDLLFAMHGKLKARHPFYIVSGYRSPNTNAMLRRHGKGVAKNSLHMRGKAVDIHLPGRRLSSLRRIAVALRRGGVGYYPRSNFVHVDTGKVRYW